MFILDVMNANISIGELSKQTGVPTKTIRFYESIGLIEEPDRLENGYRVYPHTRVEELKIIKNVRDLGLPIPQIKRLMRGCEDGDCSHSSEYLDNEIKEYAEVLSTKISQLSHLKTQLQNLRKTIIECSGDHDSKYCCNVLGQIAQLEKGGEKI
jgi:MerR family copper efflux transcriptional regulator